MNTQSIRYAAGLFAVLIGLVIMLACTDTGQADPVVRGEHTHAVCLTCHGTDLYISSKRKIKTLPALRKEVARWGDYYDPALSEQDIDDVTAYLNINFYNFQGSSE